MITKAKARQQKRAPAEAQSCLLAALTVRGKNRQRPTNDEETKALIAMLALRTNLDALDLRRLIPNGSLLARMVRLFNQTDISYALPLMQLVMIAASWLTQKGAVLEVAGVGRILPTLWSIGLAESGSAKTLAADRVTSILSGADGPPVVRTLPACGSDAQWIQDLAADNGTFWFQDEIGKFFHAVLHDSKFARIKPWMLSAYSHQPISNRLKSEIHKLEIAKPAFTLHGLSVLSTWRADVDATSMLDGFCQRPNYYVAPARTDTDMFDHFLMFAGERQAEAEADVRELWQALCAQPGADGPYRLGEGTLPYLEGWWKGLRPIWGDGEVPASFIRRIGFQTLRYLPVLHFLLGKARWPIDVETAHLATRFAEYHLESTRVMLQSYDEAAVQKVRRIAEVRSSLLAAGKDATAREVSRRLSRIQRQGLTTEIIAKILESLEGVKVGTRLLDDCTGPAPQRRAALVGAMEEIESRLARSERKRNERRLRELRAALRASQGSEGGSQVVTADESVGELLDPNVIPFRLPGAPSDAETCATQDHPLAHLM